MRASCLAASLLLCHTPALSAPSTVTVARGDLPIPSPFSDLTVRPKRIEVAGVSVYDPKTLLAYAVIHDLTIHGVSSVAGTLDAIEQIYREDGYMLAEARVNGDPVQDKLVIAVYEGYIERVEVSGLTADAANRVAGYFSDLLRQTPLHRNDFERALMLASDLSGIDLRSEIVFDTDGDGATLRLRGHQYGQVGGLTLDNVPLPGADALRGYVVQEAYSLAITGDMLRVFAVATDEVNDSYSLAGTVFYRRPLGTDGWYVEGFAGDAFSRRNYTDVVEPSDQLGMNAALAFGRAIRRDLHGFTYLVGEYEYLDAESRLASGKLPSTAHSARLYLIHSRIDSDGGQLLGSLVLSAGGRPDRSSLQPGDGNRRFSHVRVSAALVEPLDSFDDQTFLRIEATGQWTGDRLPSVEKFSIGYLPYLRGFTPAEAIGDRGYSGTVEVSHVLDSTGRLPGGVAPYLFVDFGRVSDRRPIAGAPSGTTLTSAGVGAIVSLNRRFSLSAWLAVPLSDGVLTESGDVAVYLSLTKGW